MKHEYTEGYIYTSYYVNGESFQNLNIVEMKSAIQELLDNTLDSNVLQDVWITFVKGVGEYEDHCEQCGDYISKYTVNI